jgi:AcrR family transcriptional regulator
MTVSPPIRARRRYDNTLRRERAAQTRERIVTAGADILHESSIRDWRTLTIRAVAERAGVNERTVYRHFANERALRDAVMHRLEQQAGIDLAQLRLENVGDVTARLFRYVSSYPLDPRPPLDPTLAEAAQRQHAALLAAVAERAPEWSTADRTVAAAMFDVLWGLASYQRLVLDWQLDGEEAIRAITWVISLLEEAVREGRRPPRARRRADAARQASTRAGRERS